MRYLFLATFLMVLIGSTFAQNTSAITVDEQTICTAVEERMPVGSDSSYANDIGKLYCFTKISGIEDVATIFHIWSLNDEEKAKVELSVKGNSWRTWSSKNIDPSWVGSWKVEIVAENGDVLSTKTFVITKAAE